MKQLTTEDYEEINRAVEIATARIAATEKVDGDWDLFGTISMAVRIACELQCQEIADFLRENGNDESARLIFSSRNERVSADAVLNEMIKTSDWGKGPK